MRLALSIGLVSLALLSVVPALSLVAANAAPVENQPAKPNESFVYKKVDKTELQMVVSYPPGWKATDKRPGIVFFFGGGWTNGTIKSFEVQAAYFASRGMVAACADYRVKSRQGVTPKECVEDAKSAMRWFRQNAGRLGIDPDRIVACGGSAGGHIAACTTLTPGLDAAGEDTSISCKANLLVLYNPVLRFGPQMMSRVNHDEAVAKAISPMEFLTKDTPPTLLLYGTDDFLLSNGNEYMQKSKELGQHSELYLADGEGHGFFNKPAWEEKTTQRVTAFLESVGYLPKSNAMAFDTYDGYFVSNKFEPQAAQSFVVLQNQPAFNGVFGSDFVMNDKHHRLAKGLFDNQIVISVIKRGKETWDYKVQSITEDKGLVTLRFTTTSQPHDSAEFASPLIVSIPKGDYKAVVMEENGAVVKKIDLVAADR